MIGICFIENDKQNQKEKYETGRNRHFYRLVFTFICRIVGREQTATSECCEIQYLALDDLPKNTIHKHVERILDAKRSSNQPVITDRSLPPIRH